MEILTDWMGPFGAGQLWSRWGHLLAGVAWIGLLYYFNFVQAPGFRRVGDATRLDALRHVSRRAMTWVAWSSVATVLTGLLILYFQRNLGGDFTDYFASTRGTAIAFGSVLGLVMLANVWVVLVPTHSRLVESAEQVLDGGVPVARAGRAAKRFARAQRANALLSIPMLWFMLVPSHFADRAFVVYPGRERIGAAWVVFIIIVGFVELSALGQIGGYDSPANRSMFDDWRRTVAWGFVVWAILWIGGFEAIIGQV